MKTGKIIDATNAFTFAIEGPCNIPSYGKLVEALSYLACAFEKNRSVPDCEDHVFQLIWLLEKANVLRKGWHDRMLKQETK